MKFSSAVSTLAVLGATSANGATIVDTAVAAGLTRLVEILIDSDYSDILQAVTDATGEEPITVMAPSDEAFARAEAALGVNITETDDADTIALVKKILLGHVFAGNQSSTDLVGAYNSETLAGTDMIVKVNNGTAVAIAQNQVNIAAVDVETSNGIVHVIEDVLLPPKSIAELAEENLSTLYAVLAAPEFSGLLEVITGDGPLTVFGPTNEAFADAGVDLAYAKANVATVSNIIAYHAVVDNAVYAGGVEPPAAVELVTANTQSIDLAISEAGVVTANDATVVSGDIIASNGVVHVVNKVLIPPTTEAPVAAPTADDNSSASVSKPFVGALMASAAMLMSFAL